MAILFVGVCWIVPAKKNIFWAKQYKYKYFSWLLAVDLKHLIVAAINNMTKLHTPLMQGQKAFLNMYGFQAYEYKCLH